MSDEGFCQVNRCATVDKIGKDEEIRLHESWNRELKCVSCTELPK